MSQIFQVKIKGLTLDPVTNMPIVILKDMDGNRALPIWIGVFEANAIALQMEKIEPPRPLTHDLMIKIVNSLGASINRVVVHDLRENTFFAAVVLVMDGHEVQVDSRPSDAIALAIRTDAPIFVTKEVMDKSQILDLDETMIEEQKMKEWLENIKPEDFGKFPG